MDMNNVCITGRITKDIELRATASRLPALSMFLAINNGKDKEGNDRPADFLKVYVYDNQAKNVSEYCHKGSLIGITGRIKTRSWNKDDGTIGYETYILASRVQFLDTKARKNNTIPELDYKEDKKDPFADFGEEISIEDNFLD